MIIPIAHHEWQMLRYILRTEAAGQKPLGREIRINPTRRTKDGTFLDELIERGLIALAAKPTSPSSDSSAFMNDEPMQFRARYRLTELGRYAAEYGEYDKPFTPTIRPITGTAAELLATLAGRSATNHEGTKAPAKKKGKK